MVEIASSPWLELHEPLHYPFSPICIILVGSYQKEFIMPEWIFRFNIPLVGTYQKEAPMPEKKYHLILEDGPLDESQRVFQSLTAEQIKLVADTVKLQEQSVIESLSTMNESEWISLGYVDLTVEFAIGWLICEMYYADKDQENLQASLLTNS